MAARHRTVLALLQRTATATATATPSFASRRCFTSDRSILARLVQVYRSPSADPHFNLAVEKYLLQHAASDSAVLLLYVNRPCVVIGRNQNPWVETDLRALRRGLCNEGEGEGEIELVRRASGGGTVFHDAGNCNWSVICPSAAFDRDRHAHMVVRALRRLGVAAARVNERHDIVVDTNKVSGSAYKLTRARALHHGTCLLSSPNLPRVSALLRSPAEPFVKARGVASVRSPIRNVGVDTDTFVAGVVAEFRAMYDSGDAHPPPTPVDVETALADADILKSITESKVHLFPVSLLFMSHFVDMGPQSLPPGYTTKRPSSTSQRTRPMPTPGRAPHSRPAYHHTYVLVLSTSHCQTPPLTLS